MEKSLEDIIYRKLIKNAKLFLSDGIKRLVANDNVQNNFIPSDLLSLSCASFQISIELALKALIIEKRGIKKIIKNKYKNYSPKELKSAFLQNKIQTENFEKLKNYVKSEKLHYGLTKNDFKTIKRFQDYRNKIVHFMYEFEAEELSSNKNDLIYYIIHIIFKILLSSNHEDIRPSEFIEFSLEEGLHKQLINYSPYINAMQNAAQESSEKVYTCINCSRRTYSKDEEYCYTCNFISNSFNLIDCETCKEKNSVIYDNLNIGLNDNRINGYCLNCKAIPTIIQCPSCQYAYNIESKQKSKCPIPNCIH